MSDRRRKLTNRSPGTRGPRPRRRPGRAATIFAALGDRTRIRLLLALNAGSRRSITQLTMGSRSTRQAVTKHLRVLHSAGLVRRTRRGRETLFELVPQPLDEARRALDLIAEQWDDALARLKVLVEA